MGEKTLGIVGGIGPESTVVYYRSIIEYFREQAKDQSYPQIIINSIDLTRLLPLIAANKLAEATDYLVTEVDKLAAAGASFGLLASNSPHVVFDEVHSRSPIPLLSIVEATCEFAKQLRSRRLGLWGTIYTMQGRFYPDVFTKAGIALILPDGGEQAYIHEKYFSELVNGRFEPETRERFLEILVNMKEREGIDGLILGGTELSIVFQSDSECGIPLLDTTRIHSKAAVAELLS